MNAEPDGDGYVARRWYYMGRRPKVGGRGLLYCWLTEDGRTDAYDNLRGVVIGSPYEVQVRTQGDNQWVRSYPRWTDGRKHPDAAEWEARDKAAYATDELRKAEARAKRDDAQFGNLTLRQVRDMLRSMPYTSRIGLFAQVLKYFGI